LARLRALIGAFRGVDGILLIVTVDPPPSTDPPPPRAAPPKPPVHEKEAVLIRGVCAPPRGVDAAGGAIAKSAIGREGPNIHRSNS
jgi:hypothetical protein